MNRCEGRVLVVAALAAVLAASSACAEKVMFHQETGGAEMWRLTSRMTFHEYHHADKPFTPDGRFIVTREHEGDLRIVVVDLADGSENCFGGEHRSEGTTEHPTFVRDGERLDFFGRNGAGWRYYHFL